MVKITGELKLKVLPNGMWCELLEDLHGMVDDTAFCVQEGFQTDFASVPKLFWNIIPPMGLHTVAAVVHDFIYSHGLYPRKEADRIFYKLMRFYGVGRIKAGLMWSMVRLFGWLHY